MLRVELLLWLTVLSIICTIGFTEEVEISVDNEVAKEVWQ